jgi:hypothetical protein
MIVPVREHHRDMVEDQQREGADPQPIHAIMSREFRYAHACALQACL